ncbi:hypothetical protein CCUS01_13273 [Colletotrichum cuscutae]|uniref:Uncharacterized protein n=1 Tax=Colletotrichum cuscutae TaxID=1209917 RepID=A0AAI9YCB2_9PEZI|nr:hypothetical protein CCUS01_13273 [Colletotrichum cuscutae]
MLKDILRDPPLARGHKQLLDYNIPQPKIEVSLKGVLGDYEAHIVQFNKVRGIPRTLQAKRPISEVIYEVGPAEIMQTGITMQKDMQTAVANLNGDYIEVEPTCDFTWVHLPTTNMDWMNVSITSSDCF